MKPIFSATRRYTDKVVLLTGHFLANKRRLNVRYHGTLLLHAVEVVLLTSWSPVEAERIGQTPTRKTTPRPRSYTRVLEMTIGQCEPAEGKVLETWHV